MATLYFNSHSMELNPALGNVGELKNVIAELLRKSGFTDAASTSSGLSYEATPVVPRTELPTRNSE